LPEVCPNCGSNEITLYQDRSGKCRRCNSSFREPEVVETVSPRPFNEVFGVQTAPAGGAGETSEPAWRRSYPEGATWAPSPASTTPATTTVTPPFTPVTYTPKPTAVRWGPAFGYGIMMALAGGFIWGIIGGFLGYMFWIVGIAIGVMVAWAVRKGAGMASWGVILLALVFTLLAIFVGDIIAWSIVGSAYGLTVFDIVANYPTIASLTLGETCLAYIFGLVGAVYGAYTIWKEMRSGRSIATQTGYPQYSAPSQSAPWSGGIGTDVLGSTARPADEPTVQVLARTATNAQLQVTFPPPVSRTLIARYETKFGKASVTVDGVEVAKARVWGAQKVLEVPMPTHPARVIRVRFSGIPSPHIEVSAGGSIIASC